MTQSPIEQAIEKLSAISQSVFEKSDDGRDGYDAVQAAINALRQHREVWLPIESAPRDECVLVFVPKRGAGKTDKIVQAKNSVGNQWWAVGGIGCVKPTHWQPLPPPPQKENDDG